MRSGRESPQAGDDRRGPDRADRPAREPWPSPELVDRFLPDCDFHFRLGEDTPLPDDPDALAQARHFRDVLGLFASG